MPGEQIIYDLQVRANLGAAAAGADDLKKRYDAVAEAARASSNAAGDGAGITKQRGLLQGLEQDLKDLRELQKKAFTVGEAQEFQREINRIEKELKGVNSSLDDVGKGNAFQKLGAQAKSSLGDIGKIAIGSAIGTGLADGIAKGFQAVIDIGSKFQTGLADLSAITGIAGKDLDSLGGRARDLALQFGTSAGDQIDAFKGILSRLGGDIANVPEALGSITESVNILSKATGDSAAASMDALTTAALQFGTNLKDPAAAAEDITKKMNTMAAGAKLGAAEVPQVAEALKNVGVAASSAKVSFEETNAAIQVLAAGGKFGAEGGIALRNVLGLLQKQSGEGEKALKSLGTSTKELGNLLTTQGLGAALEKLKGGMSTLGSDAEKNKTLIQLFGQESSAAAGILLRSTDQLAEFTDGVTGTNTAVEQAAIRQATFSERMAKVGAFFEDLAITVFQAVGDGINFIVDNFETLALVIVPPIGLVVQLVKHFDDLVALGEDVGNFFGLISDVDAANSDAARTVESVVDAFEDYTKAIGEADSAVKSATAQTDAVKRLEELRAKTKLTTEEQTELDRVTGKLADTFPEAISGINSLSGEYDVNVAKLRELTAEQEKMAGEDRRRMIEENLIGPTKDLLPALDAQKAKLAELRVELDEAIDSGDKDEILEAKAAYEEQRQAIKGTTDQLHKNVEELVRNGTIGKASVEEVAKALGIERSEAEKIIPQVKKINEQLDEQKKAADAAAASIGGIGKAFDEAAAAAKAQVEESISGISGLRKELAEAEAAKDKDRIKALRARISEETKTAKAIQAQVVKDEKIRSQTEASIRGTRAKEGQSEFEKALAQIEIDNKKRETAIVSGEAAITSKAVKEFTAGTRKKAEADQRETAALTTSRIKSLEDQRDQIIEKLKLEQDAEGNIIGIGVGIKKGEEAKSLAEIQSKIAALDLQIANQKKNLVGLKPVFSQEAIDESFKDLQSAIADRKLTEIAVGIRPAEDALPVLQSSIDVIAKELDKKRKELSSKEFNLSFSTEDTNKLKTEIEQLSKQLLDAEQALNDKRKALDGELLDAAIENIAKEELRERASLEKRQRDELEIFDKLLAANGALTDRDEKLKTETLKRHERERLELRKKFTEEAFDVEANLQKIGNAVGDAIRNAALADVKKLSREEQALRRKQFADEESDLRKKLAQGQIAQVEYDAAVRQLAETRSQFEKEQAAASQSAVERSMAASAEAVLDAAGAWATQAVMTIVANALATAGPLGLVLAPIIGAAAEGLIKSLLGNVKSSFGFAAGGVIVGEGGGMEHAEVIAPATDYAQFATMLVFGTMRTLERKLDEDGFGGSRGGGGRGGNRMHVSFDRIPIRARDIDYQARANEIATRTERITRP